MTAPANYQRVTTLLARKIMQAESAVYDPPVGFDMPARLEVNRQIVELWDMAEAVGLLSAVRTRIAFAGPALLDVA